jgi:hypothetical protein
MGTIILWSMQLAGFAVAYRAMRSWHDRSVGILGRLVEIALAFAWLPMVLVLLCVAIAFGQDRGDFDD